MADAMLLLLKDPKIAKELENMIKLAVAKEVQKLESRIQQLRKTQPPEAAPEEAEKQKDVSPKKTRGSGNH